MLGAPFEIKYEPRPGGGVADATYFENGLTTESGPSTSRRSSSPMDTGRPAQPVCPVSSFSWRGYSTVTLLARLRGLSMSQPRRRATW